MLGVAQVASVARGRDDGDVAKDISAVQDGTFRGIDGEKGVFWGDGNV